MIEVGANKGAFGCRLVIGTSDELAVGEMPFEDALQMRDACTDGRNRNGAVSALGTIGKMFGHFQEIGWLQLVFSKTIEFVLCQMFLRHR